MRTIALLAPQQAAVVERPEPRCGPAEVLIEMRAVGLCGSDLSVYTGGTPVASYPWVMGHEGGGEIVAVGSEVTSRRVGQRVVIEPNICCFECTACKAGQTSSCTNRRALGIREAGIAAELVSVPAEFCWPVPGDTDPAALAGFEPHVVAEAAVRRVGIQAGDRCLVVGAGSQGLMMCLHLLAIDAQPFVIEPHEGRRALAIELGALPHDVATSGYPLVFETSGALMAFRAALDATAAGGQLTLIGQNHDDVHVSTRELVQRQITIRGSLIYDHPTDFAAATRHAGRDRERIVSVMRAGYPPAEADRALREAPTIAGKSWIDLTRGWPT